MNEIYNKAHPNTFALPASHSSQGILEDALLQLAKVSDDLGVLLTHIGSFVDWWGDMKQSLHHLESVIPSIKPDGSNPFRTESVTDQWQNVRNDYGLYRKQVHNSIQYEKN